MGSWCNSRRGSQSWPYANTNKEQTPKNIYEQHIDESDRAGAEPKLAGHQRAHAPGGVLHDGHQCGHRPGDRRRGPYPPSHLGGVDYSADSRPGRGGAYRAGPDSSADRHRGGQLRQGAKEAAEAVRPRDPRARWQPLPVYRPGPAPGRGQPGPRRATLARRQGRLGEPGLVGQGSEPAQG